MTSLNADGGRRYFRVSRFDVRKENEIAVIIVRGVNNPMAIIEDPTLSLGARSLPVQDALAAAEEASARDMNPRKIVIVDEEGLWDPEWGDLVWHPGRSGS